MLLELCFLGGFCRYLLLIVCMNYVRSFLVYVTAVSLQAQNISMERSINVSITWHGPVQLLHGIFQGYQLFYRDTKLGKDLNVTLRSNDSFYEIQNLTPYTEYHITARSFTLEGEGKLSKPIVIWTAALGMSNYCGSKQISAPTFNTTVKFV